MDLRQHRPDIDGLRGVAALAVALCSFRVPAAAGGFVGVDVLLATAGFLTTRRIAADLSDGTWATAAFYGRKLRRVLPALLATVAFALGAGFFLLLPEQFDWLATGAFASSVFASNVLFWLKIEYVGSSPGATPLLNLWAVSLYVQILLFWPFVAALALGRTARSRRRALLGAIACCLCVLSLWAGAALLSVDRQAAYYLIPGRFAAFAAGAAVVWLPRVPRPLRRLDDALAFVGWGALICCVFFYDAQMPYPGLRLMLPTLAAALLLYTGQTARWTAPLRYPGFVWLGGFSYSLYLIHWPFLGFLEIGLLRPISGWETAPALAGAVALAWAMSRWIERPFQRGGQGSARFALGSAGLTIALLGICGAIVLGKGWFWRVPAEVRKPIVWLELSRRARETNNRVGICHLNMWVGKTSLGNYVDRRCMRVDPERPNYLLLGDSHGGDRYTGLSGIYPDVNFLQMTTASCRPLLDTDFTDYYCAERMEYAFRSFLPKTKLDGVILAGRWQPQDLDKLKATLVHLRGLGHRTILIGPAPEIVPWVPELVFRHGRRAGLEDWVSRHLVPERLEMDRRLRELADTEGAEYYSAIEALCPNSLCPVLGAEDTLLVVDYGHQAPEGALAQAAGLKRLGLELPRRQPIQPAHCALGTGSGSAP